ncbi:MAG: ATP-grasp domain-containing protein [Planctomycetaceae bacterium]
MRFLIYEYCCAGGGLDALAPEGRAMLQAIVADAVTGGGLEVAVLVAENLSLSLPTGVRVLPVATGRELDTLVAASTAADAVLIVAPETDGILASRVAAVRAAGATVLAPPRAFIEIASDKQATIQALAAAGVPVPAGRTLAAGERWPEAFIRPAVRKARDGTGGDGFVVVDRGTAPPHPVQQPVRIEAFVAGMAVGVSCLCGPRGVNPLPPLRQVFTTTSSAVTYAGGEPLSDRFLAARAEALARRAVDAVSRATGDVASAAGWIGVDLILGERSDGRGDRVLEINPRVTTSFVGHASGLSGGLVRAMLDAAAGREPMFPGGDRLPPGSFRLFSDARATPDGSRGG